MLDTIPSRCGISIPENNIDIEYAQNIKINLADVNVKDILTYTLELLKESSLLDVNLDYTLEFNNKFDLLKFQSVLRNYGIVVQLIFYNVEQLDLKDQILFNEIYYFNSIFFNANAFIKRNHFQTYFLSNERVLDDRENYTKIKVINRDFMLDRDCRTCQNMSCRVESNEKPVDNCLGCIHHKINEEVGKQLIKTNEGNIPHPHKKS